MKKKITGILSILLFLLLLGYSGTSYADSYKDWTTTELKNVLYNIGIYKGLEENKLVQNIDSIQNDLENITIALNNNNNVYISVERGTSNSIVIFVNNEETIHPWYYSNRITDFGSGNNKTTRYTINIANGTILSLNRAESTNAFDHTNVYYTTTSIYNSSNGNTIITPIGYIPETLFDEYYTDIKWQYVANGQDVTIDGEPLFPYKLITGGWGIDLGALTDSEWCDEILLRVAYYNTGLKKFAPFTEQNTITLYNYNKNGFLPRYWNGTTTNNNGTYTTRIVIDTDKYQNAILQIIIKSDVDDLTNLYQTYYISNDKTYVSGGIVYPTITFSGDYVGEYNQQVNENTKEENDNFWKDVYNDLFTISSGDVNAMLNDFTERINFENYGDIGIEESILGVLEGEPDDFKISWEDIKTPAIANLGLSAITLIPKGEINFSRMARENEALGRVKGIVNLLCSFTLIMLLLKNIWFTLMRVLGVGVDMYESQEEENERLAMVNSETINVNGDTGTYTITKTNYNPRTKQKTNITWKGE